MSETKQEKFDRMLEVRLPKAVKAVELLGNLARKSDYEWHGRQVDDMLDQLEGAVDTVMDAFGVKPVEEPAAVAPPVAKGLPEVSWRAPDPSSEEEMAAVSAADIRYAGNASYVEGRDKRDIREALHQLVRDHGPSDPGVIALRRVVLGWVVPTPEEEE